MKLTSNQLNESVSKQETETKRIEGVETTLDREVQGLSAVFSEIVDVGEYDNISRELVQNVRAEVQKTKKTEVTDKLQVVGNELESADTDNRSTIEGLNNNLDRLGSTATAEVAKGVNSVIDKAKSSLTDALGERNDIAEKLSNARAAVVELHTNADNIDI